MELSLNKVHKKAIIHDWLDKYGGAERVLTAINEVYDFEEFFTYAYVMSEGDIKKVCAFKKRDIISSNFVKIVGPKFRYLLFFFPMVIKKFNTQNKDKKFDWVISSSWALSKGFRLGDEIHFCYLQARNLKYIWEEYPLYFKFPLNILFSPLRRLLQSFDRKMGQNPNYLIANSEYVQRWVKEKYNRDSVVIYPPVEVDNFNIAKSNKEDYFVTIGRLEPYKRFDIIINAFNKNNRKLIVIGDGSQRSKLEKLAGRDISFVGYKNREEIADILSKAQGFVYAGIEDFGIVLVEALASGVPVIAFKGGAAPEIVDQKNGVLFSKQTAESLNQALENYCADDYKPLDVRNSSMKFSKRNFQIRLSEFINEKVNLLKKDQD